MDTNRNLDPSIRESTDGTQALSAPSDDIEEFRMRLFCVLSPSGQPVAEGFSEEPFFAWRSVADARWCEQDFSNPEAELRRMGFALAVAKVEVTPLELVAATGSESGG